MLSRMVRLSLSALACHLLLSAPASAAIIDWSYAGSVTSNPSQYGGVNVGDAVSMTISVDTGAADAYGPGSGAALSSCGLYTLPSVTVSFGGLVYQSWSPTLTVNTPAASGNCGYGPSQDGYVVVGSVAGSGPGSLPWRLYAEIRDVPISDALPQSAPLGRGLFLELANGFMYPSGAAFSMAANLTSANVRSVPVSTAAVPVPEPASLALAAIGLASFAARHLGRRRASR